MLQSTAVQDPCTQLDTQDKKLREENQNKTKTHNPTNKKRESFLRALPSTSPGEKFTKGDTHLDFVLSNKGETSHTKELPVVRQVVLESLDAGVWVAHSVSPLMLHQGPHQRSPLTGQQ